MDISQSESIATSLLKMIGIAWMYSSNSHLVLGVDFGFSRINVIHVKLLAYLCNKKSL